MEAWHVGRRDNAAAIAAPVDKMDLDDAIVNDYSESLQE
jgi:hypothetical protein